MEENGGFEKRKAGRHWNTWIIKEEGRALGGKGTSGKQDMGDGKDKWEGAWKGTTRMKYYENAIKKSSFVS